MSLNKNNDYDDLVKVVLVHLYTVELGGSLSDSFCLVPSLEVAVGDTYCRTWMCPLNTGQFYFVVDRRDFLNF